MNKNTRLSRRAKWAGGEPIASLLMAKALANPHLISLAAGFVNNETLPVGPAKQAFDLIWSDEDAARAALQYGTTIGHMPLRQAILDRMLVADGRTAEELNLSVEQVVITAGSNQFLALALDTILDPGEIVLCGTPSYYVVLGTFQNLGVCAVGVETDAQGIIPEAVESRLSQLKSEGRLDQVRAIYITTYYDNPTGITTTADRRAELVEIARRWSQRDRIYILEDVAYRELRYYGEDTPSLRSFDEEGDTVIHSGTFSKSFSPGIRVGWGILPPELRHAALAQKGHIDFGSPNLNQVLMSTVLERGLFDKQIEVIRDGYRTKLDAMLAAADEFLAPIEGVSWIRPTGGLYVWVELPENVDTGFSAPLFDRAVEEGVLYVPGECCYPPEGSPRKTNMLRLSFGVQSCESIRNGVEALARAVRDVID